MTGVLPRVPQLTSMDILFDPQILRILQDCCLCGMKMFPKQAGKHRNKLLETTTFILLSVFKSYLFVFELKTKNPWIQCISSCSPTLLEIQRLIHNGWDISDIKNNEGLIMIIQICKKNKNKTVFVTKNHLFTFGHVTFLFKTAVTSSPS